MPPSGVGVSGAVMTSRRVGVMVRDAVARVALAGSGLPRLSDEVVSGGATSWREPADGPSVAPGPLVPYLRWVVENRPVVFHGSQHRGLVELSDVRRSRDASAYGDQRAVYASQDPVWALWFALLRRDGLRSTRNGTYGPTSGVRGRRYLFSVDGTGPLFGDGAIYVLPDDGFGHDRRTGGLFDTAHRTRVGLVRPLAWFEVGPDDFPLTERVIRHSGDEPLWRTLWNARREDRSVRPRR